MDDTATDLVAGGYDVALRVGEVIERNMIAVRIGPELRQVAVATPEYVETHGQPEHRRDLLQHRCIRWRWPGRSTPYAWEFFENGTWFDVVVDGPSYRRQQGSRARRGFEQHRYRFRHRGHGHRTVSPEAAC
ncbi:HTH-type transcriptional regulator DmlR [compost metagenome]|uniref:hypothetical protein n=1 Tax=Agrobacterium sp. Ap1 TaxID=2815337 RepID=UPI000FABE103